MRRSTHYGEGTRGVVGAGCRNQSAGSGFSTSIRFSEGLSGKDFDSPDFLFLRTPPSIFRSRSRLMGGGWRGGQHTIWTRKMRRLFMYRQ